MARAMETAPNSLISLSERLNVKIENMKEEEQGRAYSRTSRDGIDRQAIAMAAAPSSSIMLEISLPSQIG